MLPVLQDVIGYPNGCASSFRVARSEKQLKQRRILTILEGFSCRRYAFKRIQESVAVKICNGLAPTTPTLPLQRLISP